MRTAVDEITLAGRPVAVGDTVRVLPSRHGRRDGFQAVVRRIDQLEDGTVEVSVFGGRDGRPRSSRTFTPDRLRHVRPREVRA